MMWKTIGTLLVVLGASGTGLTVALGGRRTLVLARQLRAALEQMKNEISYLQTPLPELMRLLSAQFPGTLSPLFANMAEQLGLRQEASVYAIVRKSLAALPPLPPDISRILLELSHGLGQYDVDGQLRAIELASGQAQELVARCQAEQRGRMRSCCTLGICTGLAIAIIVL